MSNSAISSVALETRTERSDTPQSNEQNEEVIVKDTKHLQLCMAASLGDWSAAKTVLDSDPDLLTAPINFGKMTVIHIAAASGRGGSSFLRELTDYMIQKGVPLGSKDNRGQNALHYAARAGDTEAAKLLAEKDPTMAKQWSTEPATPLLVAASFSHEETVRFLMPVTLSQDPGMFVGPVGAQLLALLVLDDFYDIATELLESNPALASEIDPRNRTALWVLANKPQSFPSGTHLTFWQSLLYQVSSWIIKGVDILCLGSGSVENRIGRSKLICNYLLPFGILRDVRDRKLKHKQVLRLLKNLVEKTMHCTNLSKLNDLLRVPSHVAAREGIHEFVAEVIKANPFVVAATDSDERNIFTHAVMHRQEKVFNLIFQLGPWKYLAMGFDKNYCTMLHEAANLGSSARGLAKISGAALQMQRELQWYKEVEKLVQPSYKIEANIDWKTPQMLLIESHKELRKEGEEWIKGTTNSYTIVAALVVTIAFAAAFTVPGGTNSDTGLAIFLNDLPFMVFAISNALALYSSAASLLMFLGILTSRYAQEDFLRALPMRLAIGLITLFFSITSMLVAFTAAIHVTLSHRISWIVVPVGSLACLPLTLFAFLQFPLLVEVVYSTFGPSIFCKRSNEKLI